MGDDGAHGLPLSRAQRREQQRARLLEAMVEVTAARGYGETSIAQVIARARVSRGVFHEHFEGLRDALVAVIDGALQDVSDLALRAFQRHSTWQDGLCAALAEVLAYLDADPALARVCIVEVLAAGPAVLARRERNLGSFRELLAGQAPAATPISSPLAVEGVMASVVGVVHTRLIAPAPEPLIDLLGPLMGMILAAHDGAGSPGARIQQAEELARSILTERAREQARAADSRRRPADVAAGLPGLLRDPAAYRARLCLLHLAEQPGASNRETAEAIGIDHLGQASRLLGRLAQEGLLVKRSPGVGHRNTWQLTPHGQLAVTALRESQ